MFSPPVFQRSITSICFPEQRVAEISQYENRNTFAPTSTSFFINSGEVVGCTGGAMVLSKPAVSGRPTYLDDSRARAYCTCRRCAWGC